MRTEALLTQLSEAHQLTLGEYRQVLEGFSPETMEFARKLAEETRQAVYGNAVFIRGLIEVGNRCRNDCLYCGIRRSNRNAQRYQLTAQEILDCCAEGYQLGFRTFVLQGGEQSEQAAESVCGLIRTMKARYPDCAVTLSLGEYPATTALGTVSSQGHQLGVLAGANVIMPNLSPQSVRAKYALYDGKAFLNSEAAEGLAILRRRMEEIGYTVVVSRGDPAPLP